MEDRKTLAGLTGSHLKDFKVKQDDQRKIKWGYLDTEQISVTGEIQLMEHLCVCILCPTVCIKKDLGNTIEVAHVWSNIV